MRIFTFHILVVSIFGLFVFASQPKSLGNISSVTTVLKEIDTFRIDTAKSKAHWNCKHFGYLKFKEGEIIMQNDEPIAINITMDMNSITNTDVDNKLLKGTLENVLRSIEFFNTKQYPVSRFESNTITKLNDSNYSFEGDFIFFENGICSTFEGNIEIKNDSLHLNTKTIIIDRTDWGIYYLSRNNLYPKEEESGFVVSDTILFDAHITAYRKNK